MKRAFLFSFLLSLGAATAMADTPQPCSIATGRHDGKMEFSWQRGDCDPKSHCHEGDSDMSWSRWTGVTPADLQREGATIDARMKGEAGEMRCVGTVHDSEMRGTFSFTPDMEFLHRMEAQACRRRPGGIVSRASTRARPQRRHRPEADRRDR